MLTNFKFLLILSSINSRSQICLIPVACNPRETEFTVTRHLICRKKWGRNLIAFFEHRSGLNFSSELQFQWQSIQSFRTNKFVKWSDKFDWNRNYVQRGNESRSVITKSVTVLRESRRVALIPAQIKWTIIREFR